MNPSSVSRAISSLEQELGFDLFIRTTRKLSLSEAGGFYLSRIEGLAEDIEQSADLASQLTQGAHGQLRVLAPVSFALLNVVPLLPSFLNKHPGIRLDLRLSDALLDLVEHRIDFAIRIGPLEDSSYIARRLAPMHAHICASPEYLKNAGRPKTPDDLEHHNCLLLDMPGFSNEWLFNVGGKQGSVRVNGSMLTSNAVALKDCALAGLGIICQSDWVVGRELVNGTLVDLFPNYEFTASNFTNAAWMIRPQRPYTPTKVRVFQEYMINEFEPGPQWACHT